MTPKTSLATMRNELHISISQVKTYLAACSLKYYFAYAQKLSPEQVSASMLFGIAVHRALEFFYRGIMEAGKPPEKEEIINVFRRSLVELLRDAQAPVSFKTHLPDVETCLVRGEALLSHYLDNCPVNIRHMTIEGVEFPLSANVGGDEPLALVGVVDLLLRDQRTGNLVIVDHKTSYRTPSQDDIDADLQAAAYSYLLVENQLATSLAQTNHRFDILLNQKQPKQASLATTRTARDRRRFEKILTATLSAMDAQVYIPCRSFLCSDCQYQNACKSW